MLLLYVKGQGSDFVTMRPIMDSLRMDLIRFRKATGKHDTIIIQENGRKFSVQYIKRGRTESINFLYDTLSVYFWHGKNRKGKVKYHNGIEFEYCLNRRKMVKKVQYYNYDIRFKVKYRFGKPIIKNLPEFYSTADNEEVIIYLLTNNRELPF
jgi:hypothetical protein